MACLGRTLMEGKMSIIVGMKSDIAAWVQPCALLCRSSHDIIMCCKRV